MTVLLQGCIKEVCGTLRDNEAELSALDRAIGDGDHGSNVARAATAILAAEDELLNLPIAKALERAGTLIVMSIGGASGPLYGTLLMAMGKACPEEPDLAAIAEAFSAGVTAVGKRGRSAVGEKTMLDVLVPASQALKTAGAAASVPQSIAAMLAAADAGLENTRPLRASKGRAAFVGERSIGHYDPGAASANMCLHAVARAFGADIPSANHSI